MFQQKSKVVKWFSCKIPKTFNQVSEVRLGFTKKRLYSQKNFIMNDRILNMPLWTSIIWKYDITKLIKHHWKLWDLKIFLWHERSQHFSTLFFEKKNLDKALLVCIRLSWHDLSQQVTFNCLFLWVCQIFKKTSYKSKLCLSWQFLSHDFYILVMVSIYHQVWKMIYSAINQMNIFIISHRQAIHEMIIMKSN